MRYLLAILLLAFPAYAAVEVEPAPVRAKPGYLESFTNAKGYRVTRITDTGNSALGCVWGPTVAGHGFSSRPVWNADESLMYLEKGTCGDLMVLDGKTYEPLLRRRAPGFPRWHPTRPDSIFYIDRSWNCIGEWNVRTDMKLWEECLTGYDRLNWGNDGAATPSNDGRKIPVAGFRDGVRVGFLFDTETKTRTPDFNLSERVWTGSPTYEVSPLGDIVLVKGCLHEGLEVEGRCAGQLAIDPETLEVLWLVPYRHSPSHGDMIVDGEQWHVGVNKSWKEGANEEPGHSHGMVIKRNLRTGKAYIVYDDWNSHTSTRNYRDPVPKAIFRVNDEQLVGVELDGTVHEYGWTYGGPDGRYISQPQASVSTYGTRIVFRSNWGVEDGPIDAYVVEIAEPEPEPEPEPTPEPEPDYPKGWLKKGLDWICRKFGC